MQQFNIISASMFQSIGNFSNCETVFMCISDQMALKLNNGFENFNCDLKNGPKQLNKTVTLSNICIYIYIYTCLT